MFKVKSITFNWKEGVSYECEALPLTVDSWTKANALLRTWSNNAPKDGSYNKVSFTIAWDDGSEYKGRYDLMHWKCPEERCDLVAHIRDYLLFSNGQRCPAHMTEEKYRAYVGQPKPGIQEMLDTLSFED